jgi:hypothetical protein
VSLQLEWAIMNNQITIVLLQDQVILQEDILRTAIIEFKHTAIMVSALIRCHMVKNILKGMKNLISIYKIIFYIELK